MTGSPAALFRELNPRAERQPKTDRLIIHRLLQQAASNQQLDNGDIERAHQIIITWADLESSGQLARMHETQLQGEFLGAIFAQALGYDLFSDGIGRWSLEQHHVIAGQTPDAILGDFSPDSEHKPLAVIELKGPKVHLDRDRSAGRTAVQQCWDYLNNTARTCRFGIVSNMVSFRLYERNSTPRRYEHFSLQALRDVRIFRQFYVLFRPKGLIKKTIGQPPQAIALLDQTNNRQREVGDELYEYYSAQRTELLAHLHHQAKHSLDDAIEMAQRLLDRVIFIAFCEDRGLLPEKTIDRAYRVLPGFSAVTNPRWQNFKALFRFVDEGSEQISLPVGYNGGLFAQHPVDELELADEPITNFFQAVGRYDFSDEINLDVLGHLFERSITELEKLRQGGLFGGDSEKAREYASMPQSAKRKRMGIYYTPPDLTSRIVQYSIDELVQQRFGDVAARHNATEEDARRGLFPETAAFWRDCLDLLRRLKVIDPACGSGAFLFQAYDTLELRYGEVIGHLEQLGESDATALSDQVSTFILNDNLYGVDLLPEAVEITQLALWIRSATPGRTLATLSHNIVHGNSLVHDVAIDPAGFDWRERFPAVFDREEAGFDCVIGNPPWERIKLQEREFFSMVAPEIATATNAAKRRQLVARLESDDPSLWGRYKEALAAAESLLTYCRKSGDYPLTGKGDINTYAVFAELASQIVGPRGRVGMLTPSGIASDKTTKDFFAHLAEAHRLIRLYDFENKKVFFPDVHASFKFCILNFGGADTRCEQAEFVFFAHRIEDLEDRNRHIPLSGADITLLNPNTRTCPIFRTRRDAEITKAIYRRVPILIDQSREKTGNPWGVSFKTMFHQTNDAELFREAQDLADKGFELEGNQFVRGQSIYRPLYEAKMFRAYDHRFGTVYEDTTNWINQGQTYETDLVQHQNPEFVVLPRWWAEDGEVLRALGVEPAPAYIAFRDITRATDVRTFIATLIPFVGVINTAPTLLFDSISIPKQLCLLASVNSYAFDFVAKRKIGHIHMNFFIVEQLPTLTPDVYDAPCPWEANATLEEWIGERVLKLSCTAEDMLPLAEACDFSAGSFTAYDRKLNKWDPAERAQLMAELDAAFFILYGIDRDDAAYILSTFSGTDEPHPLLPGHRSTTEHILDTFDHLCAHAMAR